MPIFDVRYQPKAHRILQRALNSNRLPHAYIFHGPEGVGKRTLAREFSRMLLCPQSRQIVPPPELAGSDDIKWKDACGACEDCRLTDAGTHPDMQVVTKEMNRYHPAAEVRARKAIDLGVDVVRHFIIDRVGDKPARARARTFIVMDSDQMSVAAQNALLKTLEEPPDAAFIILVTRSLDRHLPTTLSRCQPVPFVSLPGEFVEAQLRTHRPDLPAGPMRFLARYSNGRLGLALRHADTELYDVKVRLNQVVADMRKLGPTEFAKQVQEFASSLAERYVAEMVETGAIDKASEASAAEPARRGLAESMSLISCLYRDAMQVGCGRGNEVINSDQMDLVKALAGRIDIETAAAAIRHVYQTETDIANNANVPLALETLAIRLIRLENRAAGRQPPRAKQGNIQ
jgi:DNA polymerase-3 subunit delta'